MKKLLLIYILIMPFFVQSQTDKMTGQDYFKEGLELFKKKKYEPAIQKFDTAIIKEPLFVESYAYRAFSKYYLGKFPEAIADCNLALTIKEGYAEVFNLRGLAKHQIKDVEGACADWYQAYYLGFNGSFKLLKKYCNLKKEIDNKTKK